MIIILFLLREKSKTDDYRQCDIADSACLEENKNLKQEATGAQNIGIGSMIGGGVLLIGGIVLYGTAPRDTARREVSRPAVRAIPVTGRQDSGLWLTGSF